MKTIRCDNAGENRKLKEILDLEGFNIKFEFTAPYTPQQNGVVERAFATLYGRVRAMLNGAGFDKRLREYLWAECASTATMLQNSIIKKKGEKSAYEEYYGRKNKVLHHLRTFGETGVVKDNKKKMHSKLENRGIVCLFLGYAADHPEDTYRMLNLETKKVIITRDVKWLNKMHNKISKEKRIVTIQNEDPESSGEEETKRKNNHGNKIMNELRRLHTFYNPTLNDMKNVDCAFVGGTSNEYDHPEFFKDAWDHPEEEDRMK